jgi:hypothetical protein
MVRNIWRQKNGAKNLAPKNDEWGGGLKNGAKNLALKNGGKFLAEKNGKGILRHWLRPV